MRSWISSVLAAAAGGGVAVALLAASGTLNTNSESAGSTRPLVKGGLLVRSSGSGRAPRELFDDAKPAVVAVHAFVVDAGDSDFPDAGSGETTGSGFVVDADAGLVVACAHTVGGATKITVTLSDGRQVAAHAVGSDDETDVALLQLEGDDLDLTQLDIEASTSLDVGDTAYAMANPHGNDSVLTEAVVSSPPQRLKTKSGVAVDGAVRTDATFVPGGAGGPLLDDEGRVAGVVSHVVVDGSPVTFAVPASTVAAILPALREDGRVRRAFLGVTLSDADGAVEVEAVHPGSPAAAVGIRVGDVVRAAGGEEAPTADAVARVIARQQPGAALALRLQRGDRTWAASARLGERPAGAAGD